MGARYNAFMGYTGYMFKQRGGMKAVFSIHGIVLFLNKKQRQDGV